VAYVVGKPCVLCKYGDCVEVCPVECFFETEQLLIIEPATCIDCSACEPVCPPQAITAGDRADAEYTAINAAGPFTEDKKRTKKDQVTHGPNWDANLAGGK
jgi:ferredoxin